MNGMGDALPGALSLQLAREREPHTWVSMVVERTFLSRTQIVKVSKRGVE